MLGPEHSHADFLSRTHSQELNILETKRQLVETLSDSGVKTEHTYAEICRPRRLATPPTPIYDDPLMEKSPLVRCYQPPVSSEPNAVPTAQEYLDFVPSAASTLTGHAETLASKLQAVIGPPGVADPESCLLESEGNQKTPASQLSNGVHKRIDIYNLELGEQKNHNIENGKPEKVQKDAYQLFEDAQIPGLGPKRLPAAPGADGRTEDGDTINEPLAIDAGPIPGPPLPTAAVTNVVPQTAHTQNDVFYETPPDCTDRGRRPIYHTLEGGKAPVYHTLEGGKTPVNHMPDGKGAPVYHTLEGGDKGPVYHTLEGGKAPVYHTLEGSDTPDRTRFQSNNGNAKSQTGMDRKRAVRHAYTPIDTTQQTEDHEYTVPIRSSPERYLSEKGHMYHVIGTH